MSFEKSLLAAQGYIELEMPWDAIAELDSLPEHERDSEQALQLRLLIYMKEQCWEPALTVCGILREMHPEGAAGYIHGAFCLHEEGRTAEARELLLSGPSALEDEATYFYNLACYSAVLGELDLAVDYLKTSFEMDDKFRDIAKLDPDLHSIKSRM
jgi:tetratricopeptide (TPR) repeat protein